MSSSVGLRQQGWFALAVLFVIHAFVDILSLLPQPLWPDLQKHLQLGDGAFAIVFILWAVVVSLPQVLFGYLGDRYRSRWILVVGPVLSLLCLSVMGMTESPVVFAILILVAGLGISAFHPEAAALAGNCLPHNRSRAMSLFALGGFVGVAVGPPYAGILTTNWGLGSLVWTIPWGLILLAVCFALFKPPEAETHLTSDNRPRSFSEIVSGKGVALTLISIIGILRVLPSTGVLIGLAFMLNNEGYTNADIGIAQSVFQSAVCVGVLLCGLFAKGRTERLVLWLVPIFAMPSLAACPTASYPWLLVHLAVAGLMLGTALPVVISYGQRLLPAGQRLASSLTMGLAWGVGGAIVAGLMMFFKHMGHPAWTMYALAPTPLVASILVYWLPEVETVLENARRRVTSATDNITHPPCPQKPLAC